MLLANEFTNSRGQVPGLVSNIRESGIDINLPDEKFDQGEDVLEYLDLDNARRPNLETKRVNADFPGWTIDALDKEAKRLGVSRQSLVKIWVAERLKKAA